MSANEWRGCRCSRLRNVPIPEPNARNACRATGFETTRAFYVRSVREAIFAANMPRVAWPLNLHPFGSQAAASSVLGRPNGFASRPFDRFAFVEDVEAGLLTLQDLRSKTNVK